MSPPAKRARVAENPTVADLVAPPEWKTNLAEILFSEQRLQARIDELGEQISAHYRDAKLDKPVVVVVMLKGAVLFACDLMKRLTVPYELEFLVVSSYGDKKTTSGNVCLKYDLQRDVSDRSVLVVEDIVDTGTTLNWLRQRFSGDVKIAALFDKKLSKGRKKAIAVDFVGFEAPDAFLVGYGLDYAQAYRGLPCVARMKT